MGYNSKTGGRKENKHEVERVKVLVIADTPRPEDFRGIGLLTGS
jgi:hypothetical protein